MIAYCCGFNGFNQISAEDTSIGMAHLKLFPFDKIEDISFTWSSIVLLSGGDAYLSGCLGNYISSFKKLTKPDDGIKLLNVACNETYALFTTEDGECWQYFYNTGTWKKLLDFIVVERDITDQDCISSLNCRTKYCFEDKIKNVKRKITKIDSGGILNVALDNCGDIYNIPSLVPMQGVKIMEVACGFEHCIMLDDCGRVFSWGSGMRGQLGCDVLETVDIPQEIKALSGLCVIRIASGGWHSAAITSSGVLYMWGWNNSGQLGFPTVDLAEFPSYDCEKKRTNLQEELSSVTNSRTLSSSCCEDKCYTKEIIERTSMEENKRNDLPTRTSKKMKYTSVAESVALNDRFTTEENETQTLNKLSNRRSSVSREIGIVSYVSGHNSIDTTSVNSDLRKEVHSSFNQKECVTILAIPRAVNFPFDVDVVDVGCGNRHTVVLTGDGTVWGCGWNAYGQLGASPDILISTDSMRKLDIFSNCDRNIYRVYCGSWNTAVLFN